MTQDKIDFFLKFATKHTLTWTTQGDYYEYCDDLDCNDCIHTDNLTCNDGLITNIEFEYLKKIFPEYFI